MEKIIDYVNETPYNTNIGILKDKLRKYSNELMNNAVKSVNGIGPDDTGNVDVVGVYDYDEDGNIAGEIFNNASEAKGESAHAEGYSTKANGLRSHAEGDGTTASGDFSHAEGYYTTASGDYSHTEGMNSVASNDYSHAENVQTTASGQGSHAEGMNTVASGMLAHAEGYGTIASGNYQHAQGKYNTEDTANKFAHIVGNGKASKRSNAHTIDWDGNAWFAGGVELTSPNGTRYRFTVSDDGTLSSVVVTE